MKINLFTPTNELLAAVIYAHSEISQNTTLFELSVDEIYTNLTKGLLKLKKRFGLDELEIVLTTAMHSVQLLTADYAPIGGLVTWADQRGAVSLNSASLAERQAQYMRTGTPSHTMNPFYKLRDLDLSEATFIGSLKDVIFYRLTGEWALDRSNAAASGLLNLVSLDWDRESLARLGLAPAQLPRLVEIDYSAASQLTALPARVTIGTSDGISSNYVFADLSDVAVLSIGTSHAVRVIAEKPNVNPAYQNFAYYIKEDAYLLGLPSNNGADVLAWAQRIFNCSFEELDQVAAQRPKGREIFLPYINGERAPKWDESLLAEFFALSRTSSRESVLYAIILGMMFNIKQNVEALAELADFSALGVVGGVMKLPHFSQLLCDILGYPLYIPTLENAETLGSISAAHHQLFQNEYRVLQPNPTSDFKEHYARYLEKANCDN